MNECGRAEPFELGNGRGHVVLDTGWEELGEKGEKIRLLAS